MRTADSRHRSRAAVLLAIVTLMLGTLFGCTASEIADAGAVRAALPDSGPPVVIPPGVDATGATITPTNTTLSPGDSIQYGAAISWSDGSTTDATSYGTWSSSDPSVVHVTATGRATAVQPGTATVYVSAMGYFLEAYVTVTEPTVTSLSLSETDLSLWFGGTRGLVVTAKLSNGASQDVSSLAMYTSADAQVATVSSPGIVSAVGPGTTLVTVTYRLATVLAKVTVSGATLDSIAVASPPSPLLVGSTFTMQAMGRFADGTVRDVTRESAWTTSNPTLGTIDASGKFTAVASGTLTVSAQSGGQVGTATVIVDAVRVVSLTVTPGHSQVVKAEVAQFTATANYANGVAANVTSSATWTTDDPNVGTIDSAGRFTATTVGATAVRASFGGQSTYTTVTVVAPSIVSVSLNPASVSVAVGSTVGVAAIARLDNGTTRDVTGQCQWSSMAPGVAAVSLGTVTGVSAGSTTISAACQGRSAIGAVTVDQSSYTLSGTVNGLIGYEDALQPVGLKLNGGDTLLIYPQTIFAPGLVGLVPSIVPVRFTFPDRVAVGAAYEITVVQQPSDRVCSVTSGATGTMGAANVDSVVVSCREPWRYFFISTALRQGNLGGNAAEATAAADAICNAEALSEFPYKAMLVSSVRRACTSPNCGGSGLSEHLDWVFTPGMEYRRADGVTVIGTADQYGLLPDNLGNGHYPWPGSGADDVWTGLRNNWTNAGPTCNDWTTNSNMVDGNGGYARDDYWIEHADYNCSGSLAFYCIEQ